VEKLRLQYNQFTADVAAKIYAMPGSQGAKDLFAQSIDQHFRPFINDIHDTRLPNSAMVQVLSEAFMEKFYPDPIHDLTKAKESMEAYLELKEHVKAEIPDPTVIRMWPRQAQQFVRDFQAMLEAKMNPADFLADPTNVLTEKVKAIQASVPSQFVTRTWQNQNARDFVDAVRAELSKSLNRGDADEQKAA
jgi:hypothetical protein